MRTLTKEQEMALVKAVIALLLLPVMLFVALCFSQAANAQEDIKIYVDGKQVQTDVPAYIKSGRTMVPLRFIAEAFGFKVVWAGEDAKYPIQVYPVVPGVNDQLKGAVVDFGFFDLRPGMNTITFVARKLQDGGTVTTGENFGGGFIYADVAPEVRDGRTFVPLRALAEAFGCRVEWDESTQTVRVGKYDTDKIVAWNNVLAMHYRQDLYPAAKFYLKRVDDNSVNLSAVVLVQSPSTNMPMVDNVPVDFYLDGRYVGRTKQDIVTDKDFSSSYGGSATVSLTWKKGETHSVKVVVDPEKNHWDRDRSNNVLEKTVNLND
jgi:hypothetical protein